jgi:hypothetical protein
MDRKERERGAAGTDNPFGDSAWQTSFVNWDAISGSDAPSALLALGFPLAELTSNLRNRPDGVELLRSLNSGYGGLRESQDPVVAASAAQEMRETLETISVRYAYLTAKCADLQSRLDEVLRWTG